jgi:hypothetical protein
MPEGSQGQKRPADDVGDREILRRPRSVRFIAALAAGVSGIALACTHPAAAQQADQPSADGGGGLEQIAVAAQPNKPASVELGSATQGALFDPSTNGGATVAEPKAPASGFEGYIEGGFGSYGLRTFGGGVTVPLVKGKLQLQVEGYASHAGVQ